MLEHNDFKEVLMKEISELQKMKGHLKNALVDAPKGSLHILKRKGRNPAFYWYQGSRKRMYLPKTKRGLAADLVQKTYNEKILSLIEERLTHGQQLMSSYEVSTKGLYEAFPKEKQELITQVIPADEEYIKGWYEQYAGGQNNYPNNSSIYSNRGEQMRSKSEKILADLFDKYQIPYVYEHRIVWGNGMSICPDFLLLNVRLRKTYIFEYFGMMSEGEYSERACEKIMLYQNNNLWPGDRFLFSMESKKDSLDTKVVERMIEKYLL